jgi:nucleotide-binding universal stress UspA family protein
VAAVDLKEKTQRTLEVALAVAGDTGAALEVMHFTGEGQTSPDTPEQELEQAVETAAAADAVSVEYDASAELLVVIDDESVASLVRRVARQKRADLVVIGRGRIHGHLLYRLHSHTYSVVCESPCPVLSV